MNLKANLEELTMLLSERYNTALLFYKEPKENLSMGQHLKQMGDN